MVLLLTLLLPLGSEAGNNRDFSPLPPAVVYRIGQKSHLQDEAKLGTIPDDVWEKNIMGRNTGFGLVPYRRGLYGGKNLDTLELYANSYLGSPKGLAKIPWLMKITITDECRKAEHATDLATSESYLKWLTDHKDYLAKNASFCLNNEVAFCATITKDCRDRIVGTQPIYATEENACDDLMQKILTETRAKVVRDTEWDASWYLRDRVCIAKLEASADIVLESLANAHWDQASRSGTFDGAKGYGTGSFAMLVGALRDSPRPSADLLEALRRKTSASDIQFGKTNAWAWVSEAGPAVIDAYLRCQKKERVQEFKAAAAQFEKDLHDPKMQKADFAEKLVRSFKAALIPICL